MSIININKLLFFFYFMMFASSCKNKYIDSNGMYVKYIVNDNLIFTAKLFPINDENSLRFIYNISNKDSTSKNNVLEYQIKSKEDYMRRIYYFSYQIDNDIYIEQLGRVIPCQGVVFERNYNLTRDITFTISFPLNEINLKKEFALVYNAKEYEIVPVKINYKL